MNTHVIDLGAIAEKVNREAAIESSNLVERATAARAECQAAEAEEWRRHYEQRAAKLSHRVAAILGVRIDLSNMENVHGSPEAVIDGLRFRLVGGYVGGERGDLTLVRTCVKGCGEDYETTIFHVAQLADALDNDEPHHDCCPDEEPDPRDLIPSPTTVAKQAIAAVESAAATLGAARAHEQTLEDNRPMQKTAAIRRLMEQDNPLSDPTKPAKKHSASSAEAIVESDLEYFAYRQQQASAVVATEEARGAYEAAKLRAKVAVAQLQENQ